MKSLRALVFAGALLLSVLALAACGPAARTVTPADEQLTIDPGAVMVAVGSKMLAKPGAVPQVGEGAPDFQYTMPDGTLTKLSDLRGKKVLLNFWATWCAPCRLEMPALQAASVEHAADLVVLGINLVEAPDDIVPFGKEFGLTFPLIANRNGDIRDAYGAQNIPTSYFINSDGTVAARHLGVIDEEYIAERLTGMH